VLLVSWDAGCSSDAKTRKSKKEQKQQPSSKVGWYSTRIQQTHTVAVSIAQASCYVIARVLPQPHQYWIPIVTATTTGNAACASAAAVDAVIVVDTGGVVVIVVRQHYAQYNNQKNEQPVSDIQSARDPAMGVTRWDDVVSRSSLVSFRKRKMTSY